MARLLMLDQEIVDEIAEGSVIIMSHDTWDEFNNGEKARLMDAAVDYDHGGETDAYVDIVTSREDYFVKCAFEEDGDNYEEWD
jgi:hypothetical protein